MRLTTIRTAGGTRAGRVDGDAIVVLPDADVGALLAAGEDWRARAEAASGERVSLTDADFAPLVTKPEKIVCVGVNYRSHIEEVGLTAPDVPTIFAKYGRSLIGPYDDIQLPHNSEAVDWEVELGVVIGAEVRHVAEVDALDAVAGYTIVNDVSMRDWQLRTSQFLQGKTFEASTPVGPYLVTGDEVGDALALSLRCSVDGEVMQESNTSDMVFSVATVVSYVSQIITLAPGDLIAMGTPSGIGGARKPPVYLQPGQILSSQIDGLGEQANRCAARAVVGQA